jgi:glycosyltransferase involved in cell wall biosynthesis
MRIAYLCHYFPPEIGAPCARVSELSQEWAALGHDVTVITGLPNHPTGRIPEEFRGIVFRREKMGKVSVWRNWLYATPNQGFLKKTLSHISFMLSSMVLTTPRLSGFDVIIVSSPTFFSVPAAWFMSRVRRVPFIFEVRDLWPGIFIQLGVVHSRFLIWLLEGMEMFLYRGAARVVVVTDSFGAILHERGVPAGKLATITNGVDTTVFAPGDHDNAIRREHDLIGRFVVLYIGAHGISHALDRLLDAAEATQDDPDIRWVFVGEGAEKVTLANRARERGLSNVLLIAGQPKARMPEWYAAADVALVPLRNIPLFDMFIPSKMFEIMACARPIVGSVRGEARRILDASGGAITVDPEDAAGVAAAVRRLKADAELRRALGDAGRRFVQQHYERRQLAARYIRLLEDVAHDHRRQS